MNGPGTLYKPAPFKLEPFMATNPITEKLDHFIEPNEYLNNPLVADSASDLPPYSHELMSPLNLTASRIKKFMFHWRLRLYFKALKKELTDKSRVGENPEVILEKLKNFSEEVQQKVYEDKLNSINVVHQVEPLPNYLIHSAADKDALYEYWKLVYSQRPVFAKHKEQEYNYDFDFPVNTNNYDPWVEYKLIYRDVFTKGRNYWLLKAMPEWYFLQIGRPMGEKYDNVSDKNPQRPNMRDSIFNIVATERWQDERREKANIYTRDSQSIRI